MAATTAALAAALSLTITMTATPSMAAPTTSSVTTTDELVLPAESRAVPRATRILNAGVTGFLWAQEGDDRLLWTEYTSGTATALAQRLPAPIQYDVDNGYFPYGASFEPGWYGAGSDTVALYSAEPAPHVTLLRGATPTGVEVPIPEGHSYRGTFGDVVLTRTGDDGSPAAYHLWRVQGGDVTGTTVTGLPADAHEVVVEDGDARSVVLRYKVGDGSEGSDVWPHWGLVDLATAALTPLPDRVDPENGWEVSGFRLSTDSVLRLRAGRGGADVYDRSDLSAQPHTLDTGSFSYQAEFAVVGSALLGVEPVWPGNNLYRGQPLWAYSFGGTEIVRTKVMDPAAHQIVPAPDGSVLVAGAERYVEEGDLDWGVYRVAQAADGSITRSRLTAVEPVPAQIYGLALGSGILSRADDSTAYAPGSTIGAYRSTWLTTPTLGGTATVEKSTVDRSVDGSDGGCRPRDSSPQRCIRMFADGTGHHARPNPTYTADGSELNILYPNGSTDWGPSIDTGDDNPQLMDLSGRYAVIDRASGGQQHIGEFRPGAAGVVLQRRDEVAAAVWGSTLWSGATSGGTVTATRLPAGSPVETFTTGNGCTPSGLQAVGRWVYWTCVDYWGYERGTGLYDRTTKRTATAPPGDVLLGDNYLVQHVPGTGADSGLKLIDLHGGLPASGSHTDLPSRMLTTGAALGPDSYGRSGWTVDRFGGGVAYADTEQRVHIVPSGVPTSALTAIDSALTSTAANWSGTWWLSKPAASWTVDIRTASGALVRTLAGSAARGLLTADWDGRNSAGVLVANGTYTWTLTAQPADGQGAALALSGTTAVTDGLAAPRDYAGKDGVGEVFTFDGSGTLAIHRGTGTGTLGSAISGPGWPVNTRFVPFGDLDGDRCNDVLVLTGTGALRAYHPACGEALTPSTPSTGFAGTVSWRRYDLLTSPGDVDGDGRPDLVARESLTGDIYLFKGTSTGALSARTRIGTGWTGYKQIVGAGDLNGDGRGDLLALDKSNALWRFDADPASSGTIKAGVKVFDGWGASYNAIAGVGDLTGDSRADLVARDTTGNVWRHNGTGSGSFGSGTKIATGWQGYRAVV
ncbi:FG-GAP-like repeat-containing protein [Micromonospora avicenniae]|uniref:FG-GAP-like repeat-containing protein n=1 Tax=Micromonospora avicenniae TaxID=1198245 RepID=UPI0033179F43